MEYQQIAAAGFSPAPSTDTRPFAGGGPGTVPGRVTGGLVFGTLLGPEATGPRHAALGAGSLTGESGAGVVWCGTCVSGFLAAPSTHECVCGVCGTGLLFENYIVDASIFYKKQFPRYMNLDLSLLSGCAFGCGLVVVVVFMVLSKE